MSKLRVLSWERILGSLGGPHIITRVLGGGGRGVRDSARCCEAGLEDAGGPCSRNVGASGSLSREGNRFSLEPPEEMEPCRHPDSPSEADCEPVACGTVRE